MPNRHAAMLAPLRPSQPGFSLPGVPFPSTAGPAVPLPGVPQPSALSDAERVLLFHDALDRVRRRLDKLEARSAEHAFLRDTLTVVFDSYLQHLDAIEGTCALPDRSLLVD